MDSKSNISSNNKIDEKFNYRKETLTNKEDFYKKIYIFENRIYEDIDNININLDDFIKKITKKYEKNKCENKNINKNIRDKIKKSINKNNEKK